MSLTTSSVLGTRVKSCTECRQQKLKCDASKDYSRPCSRCSRMRLDCVVMKSFKRTKKATRAQLQAEVDRLKQQLATSDDFEPNSAAPVPVTLPLSTATGNDNVQGDRLVDPQPEGLPLEDSIARAPTNNPVSFPPNPFTPDTHCQSTASGLSMTSCRALDDFELGSNQIDHCFSLSVSSLMPTHVG